MGFFVCVTLYLVTTYLMNEFLIIIDISLHSSLCNLSLARELVLGGQYYLYSGCHCYR